MLTKHRHLFLAALLAGGPFILAAAQPTQSPYQPGPGKYPRFESKQAEPGLSYGKVQEGALRAP